MLRIKIPDTYALVETVRTEYGDMPVHKEKRLAVNFYNKFMRYIIIRFFK